MPLLRSAIRRRDFLRIELTRSSQYPTLQEIEIGATVHLALDPLQSIYLTLSLAIVPRQRECCADRRQTGLQPT
jgi:hypothetical protein